TSSQAGTHGAGARGAVLTGSNASAAVLDWLFPRNGADAAAGAAFGDFRDSVLAQRIASCMAAEDLPTPQSPPPAVWQSGNGQSPNLAWYKASGTVFLPGPQGRDPSQRMAPAKRKAYEASLVRCGRDAVKLFRGFDPSSGPAGELRDQWYSDIYASVTASARVIKAGRAAQECAARHGYHFQPA